MRITILEKNNGFNFDTKLWGSSHMYRYAYTEYVSICVSC